MLVLPSQNRDEKFVLRMPLAQIFQRTQFAKPNPVPRQLQAWIYLALHPEHQGHRNPEFSAFRQDRLFQQLRAGVIRRKVKARRQRNHHVARVYFPVQSARNRRTSLIVCSLSVTLTL